MRGLISAASGVLALFLLAQSAAGALWGLWKPTVTGELREDGNVILVGEDPSFRSWIVFVLASAVVAAVLSVLVYLRSPRNRGLIMLLWIGVVAAVSSVVFFAVGINVSQLIHPFPDMHSLAPGDQFEISRVLSTGLSAYLAAPLLAVIAYWAATVCAKDE